MDVFSGLLIVFIGAKFAFTFADLLGKLIGHGDVESSYPRILITLAICLVLCALAVYSLLDRRQARKKFFEKYKGVYEHFGVLITPDKAPQNGRLHIDMNADSLSFITDAGLEVKFPYSNIKHVAFPLSLYRRDFTLFMNDGSKVRIAAEKNFEMYERRKNIASGALVVGDLSMGLDAVVNGKDESSVLEYFKDLNDKVYLAITQASPGKIMMSPNTRIGLVISFLIPFLLLILGTCVTLFGHSS